MQHFHLCLWLGVYLQTANRAKMNKNALFVQLYSSQLYTHIREEVTSETSCRSCVDVLTLAKTIKFRYIASRYNIIETVIIIHLFICNTQKSCENQTVGDTCKHEEHYTFSDSQ